MQLFRKLNTNVKASGYRDFEFIIYEIQGERGIGFSNFNSQCICWHLVEHKIFLNCKFAWNNFFFWESASDIVSQLHLSQPTTQCSQELNNLRLLNAIGDLNLVQCLIDMSWQFRGKNCCFNRCLYFEQTLSILCKVQVFSVTLQWCRYRSQVLLYVASCYFASLMIETRFHYAY